MYDVTFVCSIPVVGLGPELENWVPQGFVEVTKDLQMLDPPQIGVEYRDEGWTSGGPVQSLICLPKTRKYFAQRTWWGKPVLNREDLVGVAHYLIKQRNWDGESSSIPDKILEEVVRYSAQLSKK